MPDGFELRPIFSGINKFTAIDDSGFIGMTLFTGGCNFRCKYCHNPQFVLQNRIVFLSVEEIVSFLEKRKGLLDSVIICGGEPTLHPGLVDWLRFIKSLGYRIKLDTNAINGDMLKKILDEKLVDFVDVDYKAPIDKYANITQVKVDKNKLAENIRMIVGSGVDYSFRSTVHSDLHSREDIEKMIDELCDLGVKSYFLQCYIKPPESVGEVSEGLGTADLVRGFEGILKKKFERSGVRNL